MDSIEGCNITITDQTDIERGPFSSCPNHRSLYIRVRDATETLNFKSLDTAGVIDVSQSPQLQVLDFPQLKHLEALIIKEATALSKILLGQLTSSPPSIDDGGFSLNGADHLANVTGLHLFELQDVALPSWWNSNITSVVGIESDTCVAFPALERTRNIHLIGTVSANCQLLTNLVSVYNFTLTGISPDEITFGRAALNILDTLVLESSIVNTTYYSHTIGLGPITSVGSNAFITSNENAHIDLYSLNSIRGNLSISENRNCEFNFDHLMEAGNLLLLDNQGTSLPSFPSLARANNIHLRGQIDHFNMFPALTSVSGAVIVEPWNSNFNCSQLVSQYDKGVIGALRCNGTNNETQTITGSKITSQGAKISIGVGATILVLATAKVCAWLFLYIKTRLKYLSHKGYTPLHHEQRNMIDLEEFDNRDVSQELPDDQVYEAGESESELIHQLDGTMIIQEIPGHDVAYELPSS
ncbi:hypothetical protein F4777DRAFT_70207 [Nemania sp. FL0916]|nr:hypothetical protein F4777DRAFT_70207 [Nemania sp. FL0916]